MASSDHWHTTAPIYIRIVALSIAFYDYLLTLPAEWRFYRGQRSWRLSPGCILFIAIRSVFISFPPLSRLIPGSIAHRIRLSSPSYTSILVLVTSSIGFFSHSFTDQSCAKYYMIPGVLKGEYLPIPNHSHMAFSMNTRSNIRTQFVSLFSLSPPIAQTMVSQLILGIRTINISRRAPWVTWTIAVAFTLASSAEGVLNLSNRVPLQGPRGNCVAGNAPPRLTAWLFYVFAMVYDIITLCISSIYLIDVSPNTGKIGRLVKIMLADGLVYFVALTGVNVLNLILYRSRDEADQSSGVALGYTLTWIMSQRILIHLRDAAAAHSRTQIVVSRQLPSAHSISHAMRSQFETKDHAPLSTALDLGDWSMASSHPRHSETTTTTTDGKASSSHMHSGDVESQSQSRSRSGRSGATASDSEFELNLQVQVQIEEMVTVEYTPEAHVRESYRTPRVLWRQEREREREGRRVWERVTGQGSQLPDSRKERGAEERDANESHLSDEGAAGT
ncbi:hypothetical protein LXA43DRAFT_1088180 [Ganoderma leucocontextum]|nr:hypothetical protein LXA43DRAFT_1088180 [Ganoderma leucocontextum]